MRARRSGGCWAWYRSSRPRNPPAPRATARPDRHPGGHAQPAEGNTCSRIHGYSMPLARARSRTPTPGRPRIRAHADTGGHRPQRDDRHHHALKELALLRAPAGRAARSCRYGHARRGSPAAPRCRTRLSDTGRSPTDCRAAKYGRGRHHQHRRERRPGRQRLDRRPPPDAIGADQQREPDRNQEGREEDAVIEGRQRLAARGTGR